MELNAQTLEQILNRQREENQRYTGALAENLESKIEIVIEAHSGLRQELAATREEFRQSLRIAVADLGGAIKDIAATLRGVQVDIEMMRTDVEIVKSEMSIIRRDLKEKAGRDELAVLEARVAVLERSARSRS